MARLMPRSFRRAAALGVLLVLVALMAAPAAGAIPKDYPPVPTPVPTPPPPPPEYLPDLAVSDIDYGYAGPYLGYYIDARITNQSNNDIYDTFYVRDDSSWNKTVKVSHGMPGGSSVTVRFYRHTCESRGTVKADAFRQIREFSEHNNSKFWLLVC